LLVDKRIRPKLEAALERYRTLTYEAVADVPVQMAETDEHLRSPMEARQKLQWKDAEPGTKWGKAWSSAWFAGSAVLPEACEGREVFIGAKIGGAERLVFVNGIAAGLVDSFEAGEPIPVHPSARACASGKAGQKLDIAIESYAGHPQNPSEDDGRHVQTFTKVQLMLRRDDVKDFYLDLRTLVNMMGYLDPNSLRYNRIMVGFEEVYKILPMLPAEVPEEQWRPAMNAAREILRPLLEAKNGDTMPFIGLTGHSHLDTAWLWPLDETIRKAARTFSTALTMMEQYPEYRFLQSAPCHADWMRVHYPEIFERIRAAVKQGQWEPNGGMWVEPDCNIPSGESMIRQFLFGQAFTQKYFDYTADVYWQPDVFGYSGALPQIMRGCGIRFFMTTKMGWNDTNRFPYDTFHWHGIDGSSVIAHFHNIHCWPEPRSLQDQWWTVQHKDVQDRRYVPYGFGDGGGGPQDEMIEISRRVVDLEGCPRSRHMSVSEYMNDLERDLAARLPVWTGELYLEKHRGTLTSIHGVKRGNRKAEIALRDAEWALSIARINGRDYPAGKLEKLWKVLLTDQFHDVLPGSSIAPVNDTAIGEFGEVKSGADALRDEAITSIGEAASGKVTLANSLSWTREGEVVLSGLPGGQAPAGDGVVTQSYEDIEGERNMAVIGLSVPSLGMTCVPLAPEKSTAGSPFVIDGSSVETPFASVRFDDRGRMVSFVDKATARELVRDGGTFNAFWFGEDAPADSDNWDIDADYVLKQHDPSRLVSREIIANGPLQLRIRSKFEIGDRSTITQDMVFHSTTPRVDFETQVDWRETHKLLKAGFDTTIFAENARHEIQFGHLQRPTHQNLSTDRARFEVCNHKWSDLSDAHYGIAILNDCKYGISVLGGDMRLTLLKSGTQPDHRGDNGVHRFDYALLPHDGTFSAAGVVRPAYEFNIPVVAVPGLCASTASLASVDAANVLIETVKWSEDGKALVLRLYEAEGALTRCRLSFGIDATRAAETNMLEEEQGELAIVDNGLNLEFRPFEIKTVRVEVEQTGVVRRS